jgi:uncharacterized protein YecT (DUF1311 family)
MKLHRVLPWVLAACATSVHAHLQHTPGRDRTRSTLELNECRGQQVETAEAKLKTYAAAARSRAAALGVAAVALDAEQVAWEAYRDKYCANVYAIWHQGTIRVEMGARCVLQVTRARNSDVWSAYLTYADSTPPVLPDPSK